MSIIYNRIDPTMAHVRQKTNPLVEMPHMWQPNLHKTDPYHTSAPDRKYAGWKKWGAQYHDMYAHRTEATVPDWHTRRFDTIRGVDTKVRLWDWEKASRPTEKRAFALTKETPQPVQRGYFAFPHKIEGQAEVPKWGLYNPPHYQEPCGVEPLPNVHFQQKHL